MLEFQTDQAMVGLICGTKLVSFIPASAGEIFVSCRTLLTTKIITRSQILVICLKSDNILAEATNPASLMVLFFS